MIDNGEGAGKPAAIYHPIAALCIAIVILIMAHHHHTGQSWSQLAQITIGFFGTLFVICIIALLHCYFKRDT